MEQQLKIKVKNKPNKQTKYKAYACKPFVHCPLGDSVGTSKQQHTVHQVQRDPTAGKQYEHQKQGAGQPPFPEQVGLSLGAAVLLAAQQWRQDASQKVKVHHKGKGDDR